MSSLSRLLRRAFSTTTATASTTTTTAAAAAVEPSIRSLSEGLYKERSLKRLVERFKKNSIDPRFRTKIGIYEDVVRRLTSAKCFNWIEEILEDQKRFKDMSKEGFNARLISLYGKAGMFKQAQEVFDEMPDKECEQTSLSFNALLAACLNSKKLEKVEELFKDLPKKLEIQPDVVSYNTLMKAYCEMGSVDSGVKLLDEMESKGLVPNLITYNTLLYGLYANGKLEDGDRVWEKMVGKNVAPDVRSYNAKLLGLSSSAERTEEAVKLFEGMKKKEIKPDAISFICLIKGFIKEGNLEEVKRHYAAMQEAGFKPDKFGFAKLVSFACETGGDMSFAYLLAKDVFKAKRLVEEKLLQRVVDRLVKDSKRLEAEEIVQLGEKCGYFHYKLKVPTKEVN